jgi:hypothetical protein
VAATGSHQGVADSSRCAALGWWCAGVAGAVALIAPTVVGAGGLPAERSFVGHAVDARTFEPVYSEFHHETVLDGGAIALETVYRCPDGRTIARREVAFGDDPLAPTFAFEDIRGDYREGLRREGAQVMVYRRLDSRSELEQRSLPRSELMVADAGFDRLVTSRWQRLLSGEQVRADFLVPSRLRTMGFVIAKEREWALDGESVVTFRMSSANPLLRLLIGSIDVTYHARDRFLMRYEGLSNLKAADGDTMKVRIDFPLEERSEWQLATGDELRTVRNE